MANSELSSVSLSNARVLIVQYAGDYREAYERLAHSTSETYFAQKYSVDATGDLARDVEEVGVLCVTSQEKHDEIVGNGVRSIGAGLASADDFAPLQRLFERFSPSHLIVTTPWLTPIRWARRNNVDLLLHTANTFRLAPPNGSVTSAAVRRLKHAYYLRRLGVLLNHPSIRLVSNHNVNASRDYVQMGVPAEKVVPWDWPQIVTPHSYDAKRAPEAGHLWKLLFVGVVSESKGVGDAIMALVELRRRGKMAQLRLVGDGAIDQFRILAKQYHVDKFVTFEGRKPHEEVLKSMREADVVLVPSRFDCMPMVIYESLSVRTPLVISDHPAFKGRVGEGLSSLIFPMAQPRLLAAAVEQLMQDGANYERMSRNTAEVWERLQCPVKPKELLRRWISGAPDDARWLLDRSLASNLYD